MIQCFIPAAVFIGLAFVCGLWAEVVMQGLYSNQAFWALFYTTLAFFVCAPLAHIAVGIRQAQKHPTQKLKVLALTLFGYLLYVPVGVWVLFALIQAAYD